MDLSEESEPEVSGKAMVLARHILLAARAKRHWRNSVRNVPPKLRLTNSCVLLPNVCENDSASSVRVLEEVGVARIYPHHGSVVEPDQGCGNPSWKRSDATGRMGR